MENDKLDQLEENRDRMIQLIKQMVDVTYLKINSPVSFTN
jgi:hypothetical protein